MTLTASSALAQTLGLYCKRHYGHHHARHDFFSASSLGGLAGAQRRCHCRRPVVSPSETHTWSVRLTLSRHSAWLPGRRQLCAASSSLLALASMFCEHVEPRRACCAPPAASASFNCTMSVTWLHSATRSLGEHGSNLTLIVDLSIGLGCASTIIGGRRRCPSIEQRGGGIHAPISR